MNLTSSTSTQLFHVFMGNFHSRRLLLFKHLNQTSVAAAPPPPISSQSLDANVLLVLSILLCGLICSLGLNFIVRCALRCSAMGVSNSYDHPLATATVVFNRGVEQAVLKTFPVVNYSAADMKLPGLDTECVICLSEFVPGERLRFLPKCNHGFHVRCIDKWLKSNWSCPKCRHCLIETCQKIMGCDQSSSAETCFPAAQENAVTVLPMEPESMVRSLR